jgi:preprotein translocase subunit SecF
MRLLRLVPDDTKFDFMRFRRISFPISAVASVLAVAAYFFIGLHFGIDFVGGTVIEVQSKRGPADIAAMRASLSSLNLGDVQIQQFGAPTDVLIRIAQQPGGEEAQHLAISKLRVALGNDVEYRRTEVVGPRVSAELLTYGTIGLLAAIFGIFTYLWFRFEWQFSTAAMIANLHDLLMTVGFLAVLQVDFDLTTIAALLTILGYSINDTVVVFDRIREMLRRYKKMSIQDLINISINATLSRSIITHVTVSLALLSLLVFGGPTLYSFSVAMTFGAILVGTYTTIFIAAPLLIYLGVGESRLAAEGAEKTDAPGLSANPAPAKR